MKTKHTGVYLPVFLILFSGSLSSGQMRERHETSASRVVWHFVARSLVHQSNGTTTSQVVGYFTDLDGVSGSLFHERSSERASIVAVLRRGQRRAGGIYARTSFLAPPSCSHDIRQQPLPYFLLPDCSQF